MHKVINHVIPESHIIVFAPHYDDVLFTIGGYICELRDKNLLGTKQFSIKQIFSQSNYQAGSGNANFDTSLERIKLATGNRLLEDINCLNELLGEFNYSYELFGEKECFARGKAMADSEMEFPYGMFPDFDDLDWKIFNRMKDRILQVALLKDTALIFPAAIKEHIDHFIVREAAISVHKELGDKAQAVFYFQEDKPYGGIATEEELARLDKFVDENELTPVVYNHHPEKVLEMAFRHYISQVEDVYIKGVMQRSSMLMKMYGLKQECDRIFRT